MEKEMWKNIEEGVSVWEQKVLIPTYEVGNPDKNPMFLEKRVYQGSSGRVYPHPVIDKIYDEKKMQEYTALCLENKYLFIMVLPQLGGRIQRAYDKTNNYDFVYYNHVIKPALVGLTGPWISGGIEFNWPQHHRPSTFEPVDYQIVENEDGSATIKVGEIENMFRTKGTAGFTLYPDKAYLQIDAQIYNRTDMPQTFLWWANPAVAVNDNTQSVFPPDVHAVMDHGKRAVSRFPIATGTYYKQDYSSGVDISRYKNIPVPTSYMAYHSEYDFVGGYDYGKEAGILHVADHHVAPGKKQWTWGCGDFGQAWDRNLTDEDGPYIELMTGCYTDNQPDFAWLSPYEEKVFTQYFMPYKGVGMIKNATINAAVGIEAEAGCIKIRVYVTAEQKKCRVFVEKEGRTRYEKCVDIAPSKAFEDSFTAGENETLEGIKISVYDKGGCCLVFYEEKEPGIEEIPEPAQAPPKPEQVRTNEDLFLYGQHIEQYRHATYLAEDYYREGLRRDATDSRINNAYGLLLLRRGQFRKAEDCLKKAIKKLTRSNPNPYDGEPYYNLGVCYRLQGKNREAYDSFYKAVWNESMQAGSWYQMACIQAEKGNTERALEHLERGLIYNGHNMKARTLKAALLRRMGKTREAASLVEDSLRIDSLDLAALYEKGRLEEGQRWRKLLRERIGSQHNWAIELSLEYSTAGLYEEAIEILQMYAEGRQTVYPMIHYHLAYDYARSGQEAMAAAMYRQAQGDSRDYCFPHRLEDLLVLQEAVVNNPRDANAFYYLGNLWYDKQQYGNAISCWEKSCELNPDFATVHRNLALAYYNKKQDVSLAVKEMETAYRLNEQDARVLMELDQLYKKTGMPPENRKEHFEKCIHVVESRDDLYLEYISLCNMEGEYEKAQTLLEKRKFHPWEGGEGKVPAQYVATLVGLAKKALKGGEALKAVECLQKALIFPHNLGEGKLAGAQENHIYYYMGKAYKDMGEQMLAQEAFEHAATGLSEPAGMMYYNDQPPETIFYQGLALRELGREKEALGRFHKLIDYGETHLCDAVNVDYFAVSLPDLLIFDENLKQKNRVHCLFMRGLGLWGKGLYKEAEDCFEEAERLDVNHAGVRVHKEFEG